MVERQSKFIGIDISNETRGGSWRVTVDDKPLVRRVLIDKSNDTGQLRRGSVSQNDPLTGMRSGLTPVTECSVRAV